MARAINVEAASVRMRARRGNKPSQRLIKMANVLVDHTQADKKGVIRGKEYFAPPHPETRSKEERWRNALEIDFSKDHTGNHAELLFRGVKKRIEEVGEPQLVKELEEFSETLGYASSSGTVEREPQVVREYKNLIPMLIGHSKNIED